MSTLGQDTPHEVRNSGYAATLSIPVAAHSEEREPQSELERELLRRLKSGRAALPVLPQVAALALRLASDPDARVHELASRALSPVAEVLPERFEDRIVPAHPHVS